VIKFLILLSFIILSGCIEKRVKPEDIERDRRRNFDVGSKEYQDRVANEMVAAKDYRKASKVQVIEDGSQTQLSGPSIGVGDYVVKMAQSPKEKTYKFNIKLQCELLTVPHLRLPLKNKTIFWSNPSVKGGQAVTDMYGETGFSIRTKDELGTISIEYAGAKYKFQIYDSMVITVQGCSENESKSAQNFRDSSLDVFSGVMTPPKKERLYQYRVRLQCEFLQNEHVGMKDKKFEWDLVGIKKGESYTDADGKATITIKTAETPTYLDIYYQDKKHHYGASPVILVNVQDCEI
jgi:hypothetical protein